MITYGSVCTGIGSETVAWHLLGWSPQWFAEIDPKCSVLLKDKYPRVQNLGDITQRKLDEFSRVSVIVGGTPCQAFSINGARKGMDDPRGRVTIKYLDIVGAIKPTWVIWENVENSLRIENGRIFGFILDRLAECGYGWAYRVLDLRDFGYPQSRRRVFLVATTRGYPNAFSTLFNKAPVFGDNQALEGTWKAGMVRVDSWNGDMTPKRMNNCVPTFKSQQGGEGVGVIQHGKLRKLTILEHERLQGFPDGYTLLSPRHKQFSDSVRRNMIGNSFPPPILYWIGNRIDFLESLWEQKNGES